MMDMLWLLPLGFIAGTIGSMVGLGGGIITVPVLIGWILAYPSQCKVSASCNDSAMLQH